MLRAFAAVFLCALLAACASREPRVALPPPPPAGEPAAFAGKSADGLKALLGAPSFVRKDAGIEIWRYDGAACRAFFFLYPASGGLAVRHVETLPRGSDIAADPACLNALALGAKPVS